MLLGVAAAPPLICVDPGHGTPPAIGRQLEPIGPGSSQLKIKDGGGARDEARIVLAIAWRTRSELVRRGYRVAMTRTGPWIRIGTRGNIARAQFCNRRHAALTVRSPADGSPNPATNGASTLFPALHAGWTDDIAAPSRRAARLLQRAVVAATGAADRGLVARSDLTGFNWADGPAVLGETGFVTNSRESTLLHSPRYQRRIARGLAAGVAAAVRN